MNKVLILLSILYMQIGCTSKKDEVKESMNFVNIHLIGKGYDKLALKIILEDNSRVLINGESNDQKNWTFSFSDTIYDRHKYMKLCVPTSVDSLIHELGFKVVNGKDTFLIGSCTFSKKLADINLRYIKSDTSYKVPFFRYKDVISDDFIIDNNIDNQLLVMAECFNYSLFNELGEGLTYKQCIEKYTTQTKKYSDSHFLISHLASTLTSFKSKDDITTIFKCFSDANKKSYFGKKISSYLDNNDFENSTLPSWDTGKLEPIVEDTTIYNLIIFSASWCGPCHKQIPVLKEIYTDLKDKLNIVYISIDEPKTVEHWRALMKKEQIPWRSLLAAGDDLKTIIDRYTAQTIPLSILVAPDSKMKVIDVRDKIVRDELYKLVNGD